MQSVVTIRLAGGGELRVGCRPCGDFTVRLEGEGSGGRDAAEGILPGGTLRRAARALARLAGFAEARSGREPEVAVPSLHLNGTGECALRQQYSDALSALSKASAALRATAPSGRDYYPQGDGALRRAEDEHEDRMERLESVRDELLAISLAIRPRKAAASATETAAAQA